MSMSLIEFKRRLLEDPADSELRQWRNVSVEHRRAWHNAQRREAMFKSALEVPVPEGLAESIVLKQATRASQSRRKWIPLSMAAAVAAIAVTVQLLRPGLSGTDLSDYTVRHIAHEPAALHATALVDQQDLAYMMGEFGLTLSQPLNDVVYLKRCPTRHGADGLHLVVRTENGPVTVFFLPDEPMENTVPIEVDSLRGYAVAQGDGAFIIVGEHSKDLPTVERRLRQSIQQTSA